MKLLFVETHDSGCSQAAAALARHVGIDARSAGTDPGHRVEPNLVAAMRDLGIELAGVVPTELTRADLAWADTVVAIVSDGGNGPLPGRDHLVWRLHDPSVMTVGEVFDLCVTIRSRVARLVAEVAGLPAQRVLAG